MTRDYRMWNRARHGIRWCLSLLTFAAAASAGAQQGTGTITGTVVERGSSRPLENVQVAIPALRLGAMTEANGTFTVRAVPVGAQRVRVQMIGYEPQEQVVTVAVGRSVTVNFTIGRTAVVLSGVVVTATGVEQRRSVGTALASIDTLSIARTAAASPQQLLAGSSPGVSLLANSGQPGAGGTLRLRGVNSISQGNNPLIYIDGVRVFNGRTPINVGGRQFTSPLNDINPDDIERIEIVKGPAATTLYGTEASGGVLQIFTKQGREGAARWTTSLSTGFNYQGHVGPKSDPTGLWFNKCRGPLNVTGDGIKFEDPSCPKDGSWLQDGPVSRFNINVRGGTQGGMSYFVGGNWDDERGVLPRSQLHNRGLRVNLGFRGAKGLDLAINSSLSQNANQGFADGNSANGAVLNISRGSSSNFKSTGCTDPTVVCLNNAALFSSDVKNSTYHFITGATLTYQPMEAWTNRLAVGYDHNNAEVTYITPFGHPRVPLGQMFQTLWRRQMITADFASTFRKAISEAWSSTSSVGVQVFDSRLYSTALQSDQFAGPGVPTLESGSLRQITNVEDQRVINAGFFGQQAMAWRDVLFLTAGLRVDGNSAFGKSFGLQAYPKISASYIISDEAFWPKAWVHTMKLRAALGESGKAPGAFDAVRTWNPVAAEGGKPAFRPNQLGNADLGPERSRELELGFDASALDGRIGLVATYYAQTTTEALIPVIQAPSLGFSSSQLMNVGELENVGTEVQLTGELIRHDKINLTARVGMTTQHSNAADLGGQVLTIYALGRTYVKEGYPVPSYMGKKVMNPSAFAEPVIQDNQYLGTVFATRVYTPSLTIELFRKVTFEAQGEWSIGGHNLNAAGYQNANLKVWRPCYDVQDKMRRAAAGDSSGLA
ncbi:MAG: TonB-dependent receptor domain-containing protein, partial [Gemmatimonadaceae bacterium]